MRTLLSRTVLCLGLLAACTAQAVDLTVMNSGGFSAAYQMLAPHYEQTSHNTLTLVRGPSMGETADAIPNRLARGEAADVVIMVGYALDRLIAEGRIEPHSKVDLAASPIALAVRAGAPVPDIHDAEALKRTLLAATSVAYSDSASGAYVGKELFEKLGIAEQMKGKARQIPATPVGEIVAQGGAELGFQQRSELLPVKGITVVGLLPRDLQKITLFSAGVVKGSAHPEAAAGLVRYLASEPARADIRASGLEPLDSPPQH